MNRIIACVVFCYSFEQHRVGQDKGVFIFQKSLTDMFFFSDFCLLVNNGF